MNRSLARLAPALLVAVLAVSLAGCADDGADSGGSSASEAGGSDDFVTGGESLADAPASAPDADVADGADSSGSSGSAGREGAPEAADLEPQAVIRKGNVALRADDVGRARIEVQKIVDRYAGEVAEEKTQSDDDGDTAYTRLVVRIPSDDFNAAVTELKEVGELESASTNEDDVTTEVIDVRTRIKVQERSIARISVLFQRAQGIRDIMAIESELSRRQADLEALQQQSAYLADQTSMSTLVVSIDQVPPKKQAPAEEDDDAGFLSGLSSGWGALSTFAVGLATVLGALLPWLVVLAVLGVPVLLVVRALRRRTTVPAPVPPQASE
jgi:hypothetical protein